MENTKRLLSILLFSLLISFGFTNCKDSKNQKPDDGPTMETVERPAEIIEVDMARQQYLTYEKRRVDLIQKYEDSVDGYDDKGKTRQKQNDQQAQQDPNDPNGERFDVARYVYWDYETIKNYLKYIEQEAKAANVEISTLRFYFSNYDENSENVHPRQNSIMITPTLSQNEREYIFEIDDSDPKNLKPLLLSDAFEVIKNQEKGMGNIYKDDQRSQASFVPSLIEPSAVVLPYNPGKSVTMNRGTSVPPPYHEQ